MLKIFYVVRHIVWGKLRKLTAKGGIFFFFKLKMSVRINGLYTSIVHFLCVGGASVVTRGEGGGIGWFLWGKNWLLFEPELLETDMIAPLLELD